ncbi:MAG: hypothetical protein VX641_03510 [Planctomycetota bacterium]|nr:hypothetical protein [Planctomycetota bacterium]
MDLSQATPRSSMLEGPALRLAGAVSTAAEEPCDPAQLERLLDEARALLGALKIDKSRIEARLAEHGRTDPIAEVKGHSALDEAISACQKAIQTLDRSLLEAASDTSS